MALPSRFIKIFFWGVKHVRKGTTDPKRNLHRTDYREGSLSHERIPHLEIVNTGR